MVIPMLAELCLALAVYHEARGEPLIGQKAVAEVVMNRVASDRFPDTICGVVMQPKQFSFVSTNGWAGIPTDPDVWADAVNISQDAIGNHLDGIDELLAVGAELEKACLLGKLVGGDMVRGLLALGLEGIEGMLQGLDVLAQCGFAP